MHLGEPLFVTRPDKELYSGIYEYQAKIGAFDEMCFDIMDFTTIGLGNLLVSPLDRAKSSTHLIAIKYKMEDELKHDRVIDIKDKIKISMKK